MIPLVDSDKKKLLYFAKQTLLTAFDLADFDFQNADYPSHLAEKGASFVTLTIQEQLRGCIGTLSAYQPLVQDVCEHVLAAAFHDPRFPPLSVSELDAVEIEISYLTPPVDLSYSDAEDLKRKLMPGQDGVILSDGYRRATYLPQVWEQLPDVEVFLGSLCRKMGAKEHLWKKKHLVVETYRAVHFSEKEFCPPT
jgi:AmmeMemoRadiSam system protein A